MVALVCPIHDIWASLVVSAVLSVAMQLGARKNDDFADVIGW